jgi:hypothetical protein
MPRAGGAAFGVADLGDVELEWLIGLVLNSLLGPVPPIPFHTAALQFPDLDALLQRLPTPHMMA